MRGPLTTNMKLAVIGSREFQDYVLLKSTLDPVLERIDVIVSGGARGADSLADRYAKENGISLCVMKPDWNKYGRAAGILRNKDIIENCDEAIAFWNGKSSGTKNSIDTCKKMGKRCKVVEF